jgi:hypothetical protein
MVSNTYTTAFANRGTVNIVGVGGTPASSAFAVVKDVEITVSADHINLYGWGSICRVGVAKHQQKVAVKIGSMKFNPSVSGASVGWWTYLIDPLSGTGNNVDTNTVKLFNIDAYFTFENTDILHCTVYDVYFPNFPLKANEGQWVKLDMTGEGAYVLEANT